MSFKIVLGETAAKLLSNPDLVLEEEELTTRINEGRPDYIVIDEETAISNCIRSDLDGVLEDSIEVHSTLQGNFSAQYYGTVVNHLRHRGKSVQVIIHPLAEDIRKALRAPAIRMSDLAGSISTIPNPSKNADFFDLLRQLDIALSALSNEIRAINDPERLSSDIKATRAYIDAFRAFLDDSGGNAPNSLPAEIPRSLLEKLKSVKWEAISSQCQKWAETIIKIVERLL